MKFFRNKKNKQGFSLIELLIVISIIGILATIATPNFFSVTEDAISKADLKTARTIVSAVKLAMSETNNGPIDIGRVNKYLSHIEVSDNISDNGWAVVINSNTYVIYKDGKEIPLAKILEND